MHLRINKQKTGLLATFSSLLVAFVFLTAIPGYAQTATPPPAPANTSGVKLEVKAGFNGNFKVHEWVPVQVTIGFDKTDGSSINGRIEASTTNFDRSSPIYTHAIELTPPARKTIWLYTIGREFGYNLQVRLVQDDGKVITQTNTQLSVQPEGTFLMGVVSEDNHALDYLNNTKLAQPAGNYSAFLYDNYSGGYGGGNKPGSLRGNTPQVVVANLSPADLPPNGAALGALDGLVFTDLKSTSFAGNTFDKKALADALTSWTSQGKGLILAGDSSLRQGDLFSNILPVQDDGGPTTLPDLNVLKSVSNAPSVPKLAIGSTGYTSAKVKPLSNVAGEVVLVKSTQGLPLVVTRNFGLGQIWFIAPELGSLENWSDAPSFWNWLLNDYQLQFSYIDSARHATVEYYSLEDLLPITQRNDLPDPIALIVFLALYVVVVGPINYLLLSRLDKRELAWFTVPVLTLLFSVGAYFVGTSTSVSDLVISHVSVLTVGQGNDGNFSGANSELASIYSNGRNRFKLQVEPDTLASHVFDQQNPYYYNYNNTGSSTNQSDIIEQGTGGGFPNLNIGTRGSRNYSFESDNAGKILGKGLVTQVSINGNNINGTVENSTPFEWTDVSIFTGRRVVKLGNIKPGQKVQIGSLSNVGTSLVNQLTGFNTSGTSSTYNRYYYSSNSISRQIDITKQKAMVLESLFGTDGEGLKSGNKIFYLLAWASNPSTAFKPENRTQTANNLTLLFEPISAN